MSSSSRYSPIANGSVSSLPKLTPNGTHDQVPKAPLGDSLGNRETKDHSPHSSAALGDTNSSKRKSSGPETKKHWTCTFTHCFQSSKSRYEWERHESIHVPRAWICMPEDSPHLNDHCGICGNTDIHHLPFSSHTKLEDCISKAHSQRAFARRDKLRDHIRTVHMNNNDAPSIDWLDEWKREPDMSTADPQALWCGFCETRFDTWTTRQDDVAKHFENGATMDSWKECSVVQ